MFYTLSTYIGGSIVAFDKYLQMSHQPITSISETEMISGITQLLNRMGFDIPSITRLHQPFVSIGPYTVTNVYTVFKRYHHTRKKGNVFLIPIFSIFAGAIASQFFEDEIISGFLTITQIFTFVFVVFWGWIVIKPIKIKIN